MNAKHLGWMKPLLCFVLFLVVAAVVGAGSQLSVLLEAVRSPTLPAPNLTPVASWDSKQNWSKAMTEEFHFKTQGSRTLNIPSSWFMALEEPSDGVFSFLFSGGAKFSSGAYLSRFGFVPQEASEENPLGLPIGFATTHYQNVIGIKNAQTAIGFTCAACHTGQLIHEGERYLIQGGPAHVDLGQLTLAIEAALGQTALSSKLPVLNGKFLRFAKGVLGTEYTDEGIAKLNTDLTNVINELKKEPNGIDVVEGYSRLDALNRIGNQVFALDTGRFENYVNISAPVNYPHIWTSSWFSWVQYDGSIMQPLIRNAGEAMGTAALTNYSAPINEGRFANAVPMMNLHWLESALAGPEQPLDTKSFSGLHSPAWPEAFGDIDEQLAAAGAELYDKHCQACHLPALTKAVERGNDPNSEFWSHFAPIAWYDGDTRRTTTESLLNVKIVHQDYMGTDPGQSNVLALRTINTAASNLNNTPAMGIDIDVCVDQASLLNPKKSQLEQARITDNPFLPYPYALGAVVQLGIDQWFDRQRASEAERLAITTDRPNCLQAGAGYKARPLNGVWATAPFLHNGSVPSLRHLLGNPDKRPTKFLLGDPTFDTKNVGVAVGAVPNTDHNYTTDGLFILDTSIAGNSNAGHEFRDEKVKGRIGPALSDDEVSAIIEFLKTL
ncbi:MAG: hypothetical protein JJ957_01300 [Pseudomonadales bacterium]|nr:hypothetical protein [Pseudomonadales bacterium]MBO6594446.1 hypothetical protein [Pseudomonadales bacterium]MBO6821993.1 hypothetical protein [Pseudomonadales bacterium]